MLVKICGITNEEDLRAAAEAGADALGFNFYPGSPRYLSEQDAEALLRVVPAGVLKVGVFVNEPSERVAALAKRLGLDVVQLHGQCGTPSGLRIWRVVQLGSGLDQAALQDPDAEAVVLEAAAAGAWGGTGKTFDWSLARVAGRRIVLAGGLDAENVGAAIAAARPWGVDACSRLEAAPGRKDHRRVRDFIRAARQAARAWGEFGS